MTTLTVPLFPLQTVLFPQGALPLKIFEQRYMDMAKQCLKREAPFGICLIAQGAEVGAPAEPRSVGTLARIDAWDMEQLGVLKVVVHGGERFRLLRHWSEANGLVMGEIVPLPPIAAQPVAAPDARLVALLRAIFADLPTHGAPLPPEPHRFDDAAWVAHRFCEVLPIPNSARQLMLELDDAGALLGIVRRYLAGKGLA